MRTPEALSRALVIAAFLSAAPAFAFDGSKTDSTATPTPPEVAAVAPQTDGQLRPPADIPNSAAPKAPLTASEAFSTGAHRA